MNEMLQNVPWLTVLWWSLLIFGLMGTALLSGLETGMYCLNRARLALRVAYGPRRPAAITLERELRHPERLLAGNLIANILCGDLAATGASNLMADAGYSESAVIAANVLILTPVFFVLVESVPKELFRLEADRLTYRFAWLIPLIRWTLTVIPALPLVRVLADTLGRLVGSAGEGGLERSARERVASLIKDTAGQDVLSTSQVGLIDRALEFQDRVVTDEMTPAAQVAVIREDGTLGQLREAIETRGATYVPVMASASREGPRQPRVLGVIWHADAYLRPEVPIRSLMVEPARLTPRMPLPEAMAALRRATAPVGIVEDAGRPVGMVTMDDLVAPLVHAGEGRPWCAT